MTGYPMAGHMPVKDSDYAVLMATFGERPMVLPALSRAAAEVDDDWRVGVVAELRLTEVFGDSGDSEDTRSSLLVEVRTTPDGDWVELPFPADGEIHELGGRRLGVVVSRFHKSCVVYSYPNGSANYSKSWQLLAGDPPIAV